MLVEVKDKCPLETGGLLIGYQSAGATVVTDAVGPGRNAIHRRATFTPDYDFHESEVTRLYRDSGRVQSYIGDWHSHPCGGFELSSRDLSTLRRIADSKLSRNPDPVMGIIAYRNSWDFAAWQIRGGRFRGLWSGTIPVSVRTF